MTRRRAQWRADHGLPPREDEWAESAAAAAAAAATGEDEEEEEVELGQADYSTDSPPRRAARWRHGGDKSQHVPRGAEPDLPVTRDSPGVARPGEGRLRVIGDDEVPAIPNVLTLALEDQPMSRLRDCLGMHDRALPGRIMETLREHIEKRPKNVSFSEDNGYWMPSGSRLDVKVYPGIVRFPLTIDTVGAKSGHGYFGQLQAPPGGACGCRMKNESLRAICMYGRQQHGRFPVLPFLDLLNFLGKS